MRLPSECHQMKQAIETHMPHLSRPQLTGLVLWVCGTILAGSACQNAVAAALSTRGNWNNMRQYLREWLYDGGGRARPWGTELDVSLCFAPLLRWVLSRRRSGVRTRVPAPWSRPRLAGLYRLRRFPGTAAVDWPPSCGVCGTPRPNSPLDVGPPPCRRGLPGAPAHLRAHRPPPPPLGAVFPLLAAGRIGVCPRRCGFLVPA